MVVLFAARYPGDPRCGACTQNVTHVEAVGGVFDGVDGAAAMSFVDPTDQLQVFKTAMFFQDFYVVTGAPAGSAAAAAAAASSSLPVTTAMEQRLLSGPVSVWMRNATEAITLAANTTTRFRLADVQAVYHGGTGYFFPTWVQPTVEDLVVSNTQRSGSWYLVTQSSNQTVVKDVFSMHLDHGITPTRHAHVVFPGLTAASLLPAAIQAMNSTTALVALEAATAAVLCSSTPAQLHALVWSGQPFPASVQAGAGLSFTVSSPAAIMVRGPAEGPQQTLQVTASSFEAPSLAVVFASKRFKPSPGCENSTVSLSLAGTVGKSVTVTCFVDDSS